MDKLEQHLQNISEKLDSIIALITSNTECNHSSYTLHAWLDEWVKTYKAPNLRDKGYDLKNNIRKHIQPNIEDKPLHEYTAIDITKALNAIGSSRMRQIVRQIYNQAFREAVRLDYIQRNPVENVNRISHDYNNGRALERHEETEFLQEAQKDDLYTLFAFYLLTGARPSEPLLIEWADIKTDYIRIAGTKTKKSDRLLPLTDELRQLLDTLPRTGNRIFPYTYALVRKHFEAVRSRLPFHITLKDLRHTFGTRCLESGVSMKTVQKWLGHSKYDTTANIYSHITTDFERTEIERFTNRKKP